MNLLKQIFGVLLLVSFLLSNNGITIYENTCPMSGQVTCEYFFNNCCCSGESGSGCCETSITNIKYTPDGFIEFDDFQLELTQEIDLIPLPNSIFKIQKNRTKNLHVKQVNYPPPILPHGRQLLIELETFII